MIINDERLKLLRYDEAINVKHNTNKQITYYIFNHEPNWLILLSKKPYVTIGCQLI